MRLISWEFSLFVALTYLIYLALPRRMRPSLICAASLIFYASAGALSLIFVLGVALSSFFLSRMGKRVPIAPYAAILLILSAWVTVKLLFRMGLSPLPMGVSFYSLRVISYLVNVKRGKLSAQRELFKYLLAVSYFPTALLGPVVSLESVQEQLIRGERACGESLAASLLRISWGAFKKVVIADALAAPLAEIADGNGRYGGAYTLLLLVFYSARVYCDFSGGIDVCIGVSRLFGVSLPENFERPFASQSLREFWKRWHITLGAFFEEFVFYPLSLSRPMQSLTRAAKRLFGIKRARKLPVYAATLATWTLTGLWHGARLNFVAWGVINGVLVILSSEISHLRSGMLKKKGITGACVARDEKNRTGTCVARGETPIRKIGCGFAATLSRTRVFLVIGAVRLLDVYGSVTVTAASLLSVLTDVKSYSALLSGGIFEVMALPRLLCVSGGLLLVFFVSNRGIKSDDLAKKPTVAAVCFFSLLLLTAVFGSYGKGFEASEFIYSRY